ncbi:MAG: hypothetical protein ACTSRZ_03130 [Promethearchaeota archaeon]
MKITLKFLEGIRDFTKEKQTELVLKDKNYIEMSELMKILLDKYGDDLSNALFSKNSQEKLKQFKNGNKNVDFDLIKFLINGELHSYQQLPHNKRINDGDVIVLFLPLAGG